MFFFWKKSGQFLELTVGLKLYLMYFLKKQTNWD